MVREDTVGWDALALVISLNAAQRAMVAARAMEGDAREKGEAGKRWEAFPY